MLWCAAAEGFSLAGEGLLCLAEDGAEFRGAVLDGGGMRHGRGEHARSGAGAESRLVLLWDGRLDVAN